MAIFRIIDRAIVLINRYNGRITLLLVLLVFGICLGLSLDSGNELRYPDEHEYDHLAQSILSGEGYRNVKGESTAFRTPGWPLVLSAIYSVSVSPLVAKIFNCVCLAGSIALLAFFIGRINPFAKVFAPLLLLMYPVEFYTATTLYPQTFGAFLLVTIMLLLFGKDVFSAKRTMIAGLVAGILVLAIPSFLLALPLVLVCMLIINKDGIGVLSKHCLILLGCTVLVVAP